MGKGCGISGNITVNEALEILKGALKQLGLDSTDVTINGHGLTQEKSAAIARNIVAGGFGEKVIPAGKPVKYEFKEGWFSWNTVEQDGDSINLFFSLTDEELPINYLPVEAAQ